MARFVAPFIAQKGLGGSKEKSDDRRRALEGHSFFAFHLEILMEWGSVPVLYL